MHRKGNFGKVRNPGLVRQIVRAIWELFVPRKLAWQTAEGRNLTTPNPSRIPLILGAVAVLFMILSTLYSRDGEASQVEFTHEELQAAYTLIRPETTVVRLDGRKGHFEPAAALRYFGVRSQDFDIDMNFIADLVDLRFDQLVARLPVIRFTETTLEIEVPFEDRSKALRSALGSITFKGVRVTAVLHFQEVAGGARELKLKATRFAGTLKGTGVLAVAEGKVKKLALKLMADQVNRMLRDPEVQQNILTGLTEWGRITQGDRRLSVNPGTLSFFQEGTRTGIRFDMSQ